MSDHILVLAADLPIIRKNCQAHVIWGGQLNLTQCNRHLRYVAQLEIENENPSGKEPTGYRPPGTIKKIGTDISGPW